jgi:NAD kinase
MWSITSVVSDHNVNEILVPQDIKIKIKSQRHSPILYVDGTATAISLDQGDIIKLKKFKHKFKLAFLNPKEFFKKRMKLIQKKR